MLRKELLRTTLELTDRLPPEERQTVFYCCELGLKPAEAAVLLGVSSHAVSARLYRARQKMRKMWPELR